MRHSTGNPTKAEKARMDAIKDGPCVCCDIRGFASMYPEIHHLLSGNRRRGHLFTIGLCGWHHRREVPECRAGSSCESVTAEFGPSLAAGSKAFHAAFGSDDDLLEYQNRLLGES